MTGVDPSSVQAAYTAVAEQYAAAFGREQDLHDVDVALVRRHLGACRGPVLDLGCGPGTWTGLLHGLAVDVTGVDVVPAFVEHARRHHPGPSYALGSMHDLPRRDCAGILSWFSTIHLPPHELPPALVGVRRLLAPGGVLVLGFFGSDDGVQAFDHAVHEAWRWPVDVVSALLAEAGLAEVERVERQVAERPDRRYAAVVARAV